ncbi:MAG: helix-turn-helix transcriptional regulator [Chloroflexota bacterium]|nr:helix-turn-helix transcriptional regulator [Chloroflexota bacterium]
MARKRATERVILRAEAAWDLLRQLNMSQNEFADRCDLTSGYMSQLFSGERSPSASVRRIIQKVLGVEDFNALFIVVKVDE